MNKKILLALGMGLALTLSSVERSEAWCFFSCGGDGGDGASVDVDRSNVSNSNIVAGDGNTSASNMRDSVQIGGDVNARQSNSIGAIGVNKGDISQSNSTGITNQQTIKNNDMRDLSNRGNR